jgi:hypothetical protein
MMEDSMQDVSPMNISLMPAEYPADIVSKHWGSCQQVLSILKAVLFWQGALLSAVFRLSDTGTDGEYWISVIFSLNDPRTDGEYWISVKVKWK